METTLNENTLIDVKTTLSIRRRPGLVGLPGDDPVNYNFKIGSAIKGVDALRGLGREEERKYLPHIINVSPEDQNHWFTASKDYWSNISKFVPADEETTNKELKGVILKFTVNFKSQIIADQYRSAGLEDKAKIVEKSGIVVEGIANYILYRYCLVYGRVANSFGQVYNSPKIRFYLYSKDEETRKEQSVFKLRTLATRAFLDIMEDDKVIDSLLRMFGKNPDIMESLGEKHLEIEELKNKSPNRFLEYIKDRDLSLKASIKKAVSSNILYNPKNTDAYYYGADNEVLLGTSMIDTILYLKSNDPKKKEVRDSIVQQLKNFK